MLESFYHSAKVFQLKSENVFKPALDLYFPKNHICNSMFNGNKIKVSYSCIKNIKSIINNHNVKVLNNTAEIKENCNCRNKNNCPLDRKCLTTSITYEVKITSNQPNYKENFTLEPLKQISN